MFKLTRAVLLLVCCCFSALAVAAPITVVDIAGRQVTVNAPASRVMLADSRMLLPISILHPQDPLQGIVAWDNSLQRLAPDMARHYAKKFPQLKQIPVFDNPYISDFSVENALTLHPDLIIFDIGIKEKLSSSNILAILEKSGIPVIFVDFRQKPLTNTVASIKLLGEVLGEQQNAARFADRWQQLYQRVQDRIAKIPEANWPKVVFENHAGITGDNCCAVFGKNLFGEFLTVAGGRNLMADKVPVRGGEISPELLIAANPDYYILSGADWSQRGGQSIAVPLGYEATRETTLPKLLHLMQRNTVEVIPAVQQKKVLAVYHQFYDSPFNVVALEEMAKFLHPEQFADVNPQADLEAMYSDFTGVGYSGLFFLQP